MESMHVTETYPGDNFMVKDSGGESGHIRDSYFAVTCTVMRKPSAASRPGGSDLSPPGRFSLLVRVGSGSITAPWRRGRAAGRGRGRRRPVRGVAGFLRSASAEVIRRARRPGRADPLPGDGVVGGQAPGAKGGRTAPLRLVAEVRGWRRGDRKKQAACLITDVAACVFRYIWNETPSGRVAHPCARTRPRTRPPRTPDAPSSPPPPGQRTVPAVSGAPRGSGREGRATATADQGD